MPIDRLELSRQVGEVATYLDEQRGVFGARLRRALQAAHGLSEPDVFPGMRDRIETHRGTYSWLVPGLTEPLTTSIPPAPPPRNHIVLAVDGSQIEIDRDSPVDCYLINTGRVSIRYGDRPDAVIDSVPRIYYRSEELVIGGRRRPGREHVVGSSVIAARRDTAEVSALADMAERLPEGVPAIGLLDGSLTQWRISEADSAAHPEIRAEYLAALSRLQQVAQTRDFAVASYISRPRAREVINALRIAICPYETPNCAAFCADKAEGERPCDEVARVRDRDIFEGLLTEPGHRSAPFRSHADEVKAYAEHAPHFFYTRTQRELARVEVPQWSLERIDLLHALLWNQIRLGDDYPVALAEAHEEAVVRQDDRNLFRLLLEEEGLRLSIPDSVSAKSASKRSRSL